ncbi:MAG: hypothetical protein B6U78_01465 [Candidatus Aenigmarchaeota archaeon ex4484_224]|nr:MAG: hypothetical protein B6U78_01465 [Candidatus Aenigmarchaeota archaeon ex4484_224]
MENEKIWEFLENEVIHRSNCLKTKTSATIVKNEKILSVGWNSCSPIVNEKKYKYDERLEVCPRMNVPSGTGYELCSPVHAEVRAVLNLRSINPIQNELKRFASHRLSYIFKTIKKELYKNSEKKLYEVEENIKIAKVLLDRYFKGIYLKHEYGEVYFEDERYKLNELKGSELYLIGHYWICATCETVLRSIGIEVFYLNKEIAEKVKERYIQNKLTGKEDNLKS